MGPLYSVLVETSRSAGLAVIKFNHGSKMFERVLEEMGCATSRSTSTRLSCMDADRLYFSKRKHSTEEKEARKRRRRVRKGLEEDTMEEEGVTYASGGF